MKKFYSFLIVSLLLTNVTFAQTVLNSDDFESYDVGAWISNADFWSTWDNTHEGANDAKVTDAFNSTSGGSKSLEIKANNDIVGYFGDKSSGKYEVKFKYYVETGDGGYFNIQQVFGSKWAFSVNFDNGGNATINYNGTTNTIVPFPQDAWFPVSIVVDLDIDTVTLTINEANPTKWKYSTVESGGEGEKVLDCVNFYGTANTGTANYYVDDFEFIELAAGTTPPEIEVSVSELSLTNSFAQTFKISNTGEDALNFEVYAYYPSSAKNQITGTRPHVSSSTKKFSVNNFQTKAVSQPNIFNNRDNVSLTHLTGDIGSAVGWSSEVTIHAVAYFDNAFVKNYIGMSIDNVVIYCKDAPIGTSSVEIWDGYDMNVGGPTNLLVSKDFTPTPDGQQIVTLDAPIYISGKDLYVGWTYTDPGSESFSLSMDAGPPVQDVNLVKQGVAWSAINAADRGNFGIVANASGTAITPWLSFDVNEGSINGGEDKEITVTPNHTGLSLGDYSAVIVVKNNDFDEFFTEIPVTMSVNAIDDLGKVKVSTFPNPATETVTIQSDVNINDIQIVTINGQVVEDIQVNADSKVINISNLSQGIYFVNINTVQGSTTTKLVVK